MTLPDFDEMTLSEVRNWGADLASHARQFGEIKATLIVNCEETGMLGQNGITYDKSYSVLRNLTDILETLLDRLGDG